MRFRTCAATLAMVLFGSPTLANRPAAIIVPFDFSNDLIEFAVTIKGAPLHVMLDTGVNPSVVAIAQATSLGLPIDKGNGGPGSGFGEGGAATSFPSRIDELAIAGHSFASFDALATDLTALSTRLGHRLDAVIGYSFLSGKSLLFDYPAHQLVIGPGSRDIAAIARTCRLRWSVPMTTYSGTPVIQQFRLGVAVGPGTIDTGSNGGIALFKPALQLSGIRPHLSQTGAITHAGFNGQAKSNTYVFTDKVGFGPFSLAAGEPMSLHSEAGETPTQMANLGNKLFATMKLRMLLDYRRSMMMFFGNCH